MTNELSEEWYKNALESNGISMRTISERIHVKRTNDERFFGSFPTDASFSAIFAAVTGADKLYDLGVAEGRKQAFAELRELIGAAPSEN